jgi:hypothetical protein|tara:strand:- start:778 stop:1020 length:243 start_codon:yes stop_codon:yes gene_type:complete
MERQIEFRLIEEEDMPPIVITIGENLEPKVVLNAHHRIWMGWKRKMIGGVAKSLYDKIDELLDSYLADQYQLQEMDTWEE